MNICFLMYDWEDIEPEVDSSLRIIHEAYMRNHTVGLTHSSRLTIRGSLTSAFCRMLTRMDNPPTNIPAFYKKVSFREQMVPLSGFDVIFMRDNPPLDPVMLNFLDTVKHDTFIVNDIEGLRKANNKLYPAAFHDDRDEFIPVTHVSKNKKYLMKIIEESRQAGHDRMILKPLNGFGGRGVILLETSAAQNVSSLLDFYISGQGNANNYVILQDFIPGAEKGDVRVLMLNGKAIGAMRRVPAEGDIRSNVHAGGRVEKHTLSRDEIRLCEKIGPQLVNDGLYFVGLDIINGKLLEINVCSPGGITRINKLNRVRLQEKIMDYLESVVHDRERRIERKQSMKKTVENA